MVELTEQYQSVMHLDSGEGIRRDQSCAVLLSVVRNLGEPWPGGAGAGFLGNWKGVGGG